MKVLVFVTHFYILKKLWTNNLITHSFRRIQKFCSQRDLLIKSDITAFTLNPAQSVTQVTATGLDPSHLYFHLNNTEVQRRLQD